MEGLDAHGLPRAVNQWVEIQRAGILALSTPLPYKAARSGAEAQRQQKRHATENTEKYQVGFMFLL
jgi:hypothetical protein